MRLTIPVLAAVAALLTAAAPAAATQYVDDDSANVAGPCTQASPCATISKGIDLAADDETIVVGGGTYDESLVLGDGKSIAGMAYETSCGACDTSGPALVVGQGGDPALEIVFGDPAGTVSDLTLRGDPGASSAVVGDHVRLSENRFDAPAHPSGLAEVYVTGGTSAEIVDNTFVDAAHDAFHPAIAIRGVPDALVRGNRIEGYTDGITVDEGATARVEENVIEGTHSVGLTGNAIQVRGATGKTTSATLVANRIDEPGNGSRGIAIHGQGQPISVALRRNVVLRHTEGIFVAGAGSGTTLDGDAVALGARPLWVDGSAAATTVAAQNVTLHGSSGVRLVDDASLVLDSSAVVGASIDDDAAASCDIAFSRGPLPHGPECDGFSTAADPGFVDEAGGDVHLAAGSAMIDAGNSGTPLAHAGGEDLDGEPRVSDGDGDGVARRDIGADELTLPDSGDGDGDGDGGAGAGDGDPAPLPPPPLTPPAVTGPPPVVAPPPDTRAGAALRIRRALLRRGVLRLLVTLDRRATGTVRVTLRARRRTVRFRARIRNGRVVVRRRLPKALRRVRVARVSVAYAGNARVLPDAKRARASKRRRA